MNLKMAHLNNEKWTLHSSIPQWPPALFMLLSLLAFLYIHFPFSSVLYAKCKLTVSILWSFMPAVSLTNHVAWQCLLSNATNQAHCEVNWHGHSCDGCQALRHYWFKRIAPHLGGWVGWGWGWWGVGGLSMCQLPTIQPQITSTG